MPEICRDDIPYVKLLNEFDLLTFISFKTGTILVMEQEHCLPNVKKKKIVIN